MGETIPLFFVGQSHVMTRTITAADVDAFAQTTGDTNPVHLDESYARTTRFEHRIAHGMLVGSLISGLLGTEFPGPGTIYMSQGLTFLRPVYLGDTLTVTVTVTKYRPEKAILSLDTAITNQRGEKVVSGEAVCLVSDLADTRAGRSGAAAG
jgi:3-hydroxybutyryl-CoA dehydratase